MGCILIEICTKRVDLYFYLECCKKDFNECSKFAEISKTARLPREWASAIDREGWQK